MYSVRTLPLHQSDAYPWRGCKAEPGYVRSATRARGDVERWLTTASVSLCAALPV